MKKTLISLLLVLSMLLSTALPAFAVGAADVQAVTESANAQEPITLGETDIPYEGEVETGFAPNVELPTAEAGVKVEEQTDAEVTLNPTLNHGINKAEGNAAEDEVTFIVVLNTRPLLKAGFTTGEIATATKAVTDYQAVQQKALNTLRRSVTAELGVAAEIGFTYTIATTGMAVKTAYGNRAALEAMEGVDYVYVAPTFSLPETELQPFTGNAGSMIGGTWMNDSGYTGKGMKIAILDTGLRVDHPNFAALPDDKLTEDSMTRDGVEEIWDTLNAGKMTNMLNTSYKNSKVPFAFNYVAASFDVDNTFAGSDHGTHVAGIAAANKIEGSNVVGVAPDAQVIVMQVFQQNGGAGWDTIMAALEDAVRLNVDTANLSLGSAAGYTDPQNETGKGFTEVLNLYAESDMNVMIAAGNDTNNAYGNLWGLNMSLSGNPDIGLAGTPSTYSAALSVASVDNDAKDMFWFTFEGKEVGFTDTATTSATRFSANFSAGQELTYVAVPGTGAASDYEGLDVTGKVALVRRGSLSFPEKQANAQAAGAIAVVVYDNVYGAMINMQINDGVNNIPAIFVQKADGDAMAAKGTGTFIVGDGSQKTFNVTRTVSDFSSWGVTPDLKLKPEIAGVGGNVYATVDPSISGSWYGTMSGTSMASPNVTGAMTVLMQYLREVYNLEGTELRRVAANLMMSSADPLMQGSSEYSPRAQGAGLVDLKTAVNAGAYLSNAAASEGRPKAEFGDDPECTGVYEFSFEINNLQSFSKTYTLDASVLTETLYADAFIANQSYALNPEVEFFQTSELDTLKYDFNHDGTVDTADARVLLRHVNNVALIAEDDVCYPYIDVNGDGSVNKTDVDVIVEWCAGLTVAVNLLEKITVTEQESITSVTVGPDATTTVNVRITLSQADKDYMASFENGIYVEGYIYVNAEEETEVKSLNMPFVGFYGDWSKAPIFDSADPNEASLGAATVATNNAYLGTNPYLSTGRSGDEYNAFSYSNPLYLIDVGVLRNIRDLKVTATDIKTGDVYYDLTGSYLTKSYYMAGYGYIYTMQFVSFYGEVWDGKVYEDENDVNGKLLPDGTKVRYEIKGWLDDGDDIMDDSFGFDVTIDDQAPIVHNQFSLDESIAIRESDNHVLLTLNIEENEHVAAVLFLASDGSIMGKYETINTPGVAEDFTYDITGYGTDFTIIVADYACNENEFDVSLNLGDYTDVAPTLAELSKNRLYGCETFNGAAIDGGWFSVNKADFTDLKNETFDSSKRYYSGEYINGYIIAQSAATGHLELITPTGTYWKTQTIASNNGNVGDYGVWVLYDMALDHSGTLSTALGRRGGEESPTDSLMAVGWYYMGDQDNNGKDDGYNALFMVSFSEWGNSVQTVARIVGTEDGAEILTFAISTDGVMYGISTDGKLYTLEPKTEWSDDYGCYTIQANYVGTTDFVNYAGYGGVNVIQSMCWDHNNGKLCWFAHSQVSAGAYYNNYNVTYEVNPETAECTVLGTYGPGGQTASFVPNDLESDLFTMGVQATRFTLDPSSIVMAKTQTKRLTINWEPWNAAASEVTWESDNESVVTVDEYGKITAVGEGTATISATAQCMLAGYWDFSTDPWTWVDGGLGDYTTTCTVTVVPSQDEIYGFIIEDFSTTEADLKWISYSDTEPTNIADHGQSLVTVTDMEGNETETPAMWSGGAYFNGYVYTVLEEQRIVDGAIAHGTGLYKSKVTKTEEGTTIGQPEFVGFQQGMVISAMGFDYTTSRMYCTENNYIGGLGIMDLDTGLVDMLGLPNGDLSGAVYIPALCVTADGTLVISDAIANLYTMNPDTLTTTRIHSGEGDANSAYYEAMHYDHETGNIYWNMCDGNGASPLYLVRLPQYAGEQATVVSLGAVSSKKGTQQTVIFTLPENEPEAKLLPVESIEITNGETITGLLGGSAQLNTVTVPSRPTVRTRTWTSSDESVVTVDRNGVISYVGIGTATVTVSITNKDEATYGGPFTDSIEVTVKEAAGEFVAFLNSDENATMYYDFWLRGNDYDLRHTKVEQSMISIYSLRTGTYYDGNYYAVNSKGEFMRINMSDPADYKVVGNLNLDYTRYQLTAMAFDYTTNTMYGLTLPTNYDYTDWTAVQHPGELVSINLNNGQLTTIAELDYSTPVFALACDLDGQLYAAGGAIDDATNSNKLYKLDKTTGALTEFLSLGDAYVYTGPTYYTNIYWNTQMTYDMGTNRLYLYATAHGQYTNISSGMHMVELGETPSVSYLDGISLELSRGDIKYGDVYLGLLAFIPEAEEVPVTKVNGIILNKDAGRVAVGGTAQINAQVRPSNAADPSLTWSSSDESIATVDQNGLVTGIAAGQVDITITSNETGISSICKMTVVEISGPQSVGYTVSAQKDALISFNPALPAQTTEIVSTLSGGTTIKGMVYGDDCLYYLTMSGWSYYLYRYDLTTKQTSSMGQLYLFTEPTGLAYAPAPMVLNEETGEMEKSGSDFFYVTAGFYLFQFQADKLDPASFNYYTNYIMDSDFCTLSGVTCVDGAIYTFGNGFYTSTAQIMRYSDKYLSDRTVIVDELQNVKLVDGATDFAYDSSTGLFYVADAGNVLHCFDLDDIYTNEAGKKVLPTATVDILGDGIDINGLAIKPAQAE